MSGELEQAQKEPLCLSYFRDLRCSNPVFFFFYFIGVAEIDQILTVLLSTSMAVGCIVALILDNTIPGTDEERGIKTWRQHLSSDDGEEQGETAPIEVYDLPCGLNRLSKYKVSKYLPFLPYKGYEHNVTPGIEAVDFNGVL